MDPCYLPKSEQQAADVKRRQRIPNSSGSDELAVIMQKHNILNIMEIPSLKY